MGRRLYLLEAPAAGSLATPLATGIHTDTQRSKDPASCVGPGANCFSIKSRGEIQLLARAIRRPARLHACPEQGGDNRRTEILGSRDQFTLSMSNRRKLVLITTALVALVIALSLCWPKPKGYTYQGMTVEEWFRAGLKTPRGTNVSLAFPTNVTQAFAAMGTNAAPYLASRITRNIDPSWFDRCTQKLPGNWQPMSKALEAEFAAYFLRRTGTSRPMIFNLVKSSYQSTNHLQQAAAHSAMVSQDR